VYESEPPSKQKHKVHRQNDSLCYFERQVYQFRAFSEVVIKERQLFVHVLQQRDLEDTVARSSFFEENTQMSLIEIIVKKFRNFMFFDRIRENETDFHVNVQGCHSVLISQFSNCCKKQLFSMIQL
jgi:hypothetical protein